MELCLTFAAAKKAVRRRHERVVFELRVVGRDEAEGDGPEAGGLGFVIDDLEEFAGGADELREGAQAAVRPLGRLAPTLTAIGIVVLGVIAVVAASSMQAAEPAAPPEGIAAGGSPIQLVMTAIERLPMPAARMTTMIAAVSGNSAAMANAQIHPRLRLPTPVVLQPPSRVSGSR